MWTIRMVGVGVGGVVVVGGGQGDGARSCWAHVACLRGSVRHGVVHSHPLVVPHAPFSSWETEDKDMMNLNLKVLIAIYLLGSGRCKELVMQAGTCVFPKKKRKESKMVRAKSNMMIQRMTRNSEFNFVQACIIFVVSC
jgi:hypothetical protein